MAYSKRGLGNEMEAGKMTEEFAYENKATASKMLRSNILKLAASMVDRAAEQSDVKLLREIDQMISTLAAIRNDAEIVARQTASATGSYDFCFFCDYEKGRSDEVKDAIDSLAAMA